MFDFFQSDAFTIGLEIAFLVFIFYDLRKYLATKKREYMVNIVLAVGFFIYTAIPFYKKYATWSDADRLVLQAVCEKENEAKLCDCLSDAIEKEYTFEAYDKAFETEELKIFVDETLTECKED